MSGSYDVIILGVGAMGAAAADELSRRGLRVLGLEQFDIPNALGSSHGGSRMIRMAYFEHADYVPLLRRAYERWHELEDRADAELLHLTGGLYMGPPNCELIEGSLQAAREHGLAHELLDRDALRRRFGVFHVPENHVGLLEPVAGFLEPEKCLAALAQVARRQGAELRPNVAVHDWSADTHGITVKTADEMFHADRLLITAGAWTGKRVPSLASRLNVTRQTLAWFAPAEPDRFALGAFPVWALHRPAGGIYYGFPMMADPLGLKLAIHASGESTDPDRVDRSLRPGEHDELSRLLARFLPNGVGPLVKHKVCLYTNSPDGHFIVNTLLPRVTIACGFSGHGFKFASVMGEVLADLVIHEKTPLPAGFLTHARFQ